MPNSFKKKIAKLEAENAKWNEEKEIVGAHLIKQAERIHELKQELAKLKDDIKKNFALCYHSSMGKSESLTKPFAIKYYGDMYYRDCIPKAKLIRLWKDDEVMLSLKAKEELLSEGKEVKP